MKTKFRHQILLLLSIFSLFACSEEHNLKISGSIEGAEGKTIYLDELLVSGTQLIDSVKVKKDGTFEFQHDASHPTFFLVRLTSRNFITLVGDSADAIVLNGTYDNFAKDYSVTGSEASVLVQELNLRMRSTRDQLDSLIQEAQSSGNNQTRLTELESKFKTVMDEQTAYSTKFVKDHPFSMASVMALYQKFDANTFVVQDLQTMKVAASALNAVFPKSGHVKALHSNTIRLMKKQKEIEVSKMLQKYAINSPDIKLPNVDGKEVALSSFRGKHVLLQFWSAKDRGSRILNPVLVHNYKKYKRKGFEIYQVSVDTDEATWKRIIKEDKLTWTNVGDMKGSNSALYSYNVRQVPFNYLLDPEGNILARNLKGPALEQALKEVLK